MISPMLALLRACALVAAASGARMMAAPPPAAAPTTDEGAAGALRSPSLDHPAVIKDFRRGLREQHLKALDDQGESITIMAVGESGVGKTSFFSNLFHTQLRPNTMRTLKKTTSIDEQTVTFNWDGLPFSAKLVDSPGYGDTIDLTTTFRVATNYIESCFNRNLAQEARAKRQLPHERERHLGIDVILYFFAPHRCKGADVAFLQRLKNKAPIVPILAKADTMTSEELQVCFFSLPPYPHPHPPPPTPTPTPPLSRTHPMLPTCRATRVP